MAYKRPTEPETLRPERVHSGGKTGISLLVVTVLTLVVLAVAKPWAGTGPAPAPPAELAASPSAVPTPSPTLSPPGTAAPVGGIAAIDWQALGATLTPRDAWGIRTVIYRRDNTVREEWTPIHSSDADVRAAVNNADTYAVLASDGTIAALGVTTPLGDLPLDVRAWRDAAGSPAGTAGWRSLALTGSTPSGDPSARLLRLPDEWSGGNGWPAGEYEVDILLESGVVHVHLWLSGDEGPIPTPPAPRAAPATAQLQAMANTPGGFIASGTVTVPYVFSGIPSSTPPHDEFDSWLALRSNHIFWAPGLYEPQPTLLGTASVLGAALPQGQAFTSATLTEVAPISADLGTAQLLPGPDGPLAGQNAVAVFRPADQGVGFASAVYRIDGIVQTKAGLVAMSWDLPVIARPSSTESFLLAADRAWPNLPTGGWTVLAPGRRTRISPKSSADLPADPGTTCRGGADVGVLPWYLGVAHPGAAIRGVTVWHLSGPSRDTPLDVQNSQLVDGFVTIRPIATDWLPGRYAIVMTSGTKVETITVCVQ